MFRINIRATSKAVGVIPLKSRNLPAPFHTRSIFFNEPTAKNPPVSSSASSSSPGSSAISSANSSPSFSSTSAESVKNGSSAFSSASVKPKSYFDDPSKTPQQVKSKFMTTEESQNAPQVTSVASSASDKPTGSFLRNLFNRQSSGTKPSANSTPKAPASPPIFQSASQQTSAVKQPSSTRVESFSNVGFTLLIGVLIYFAIDNYHARLLLQDEMFEKTLKQQKALAIAQASFKNVREKREMQMLNERKNTQKREMKMALHIGLLRQQLRDAGIDPVDINFANKEFEKSVKMENSLANLTGTSLWVVDEADIKKYMPNTHDYDTRNGK